MSPPTLILLNNHAIFFYGVAFLLAITFFPFVEAEETRSASGYHRRNKLHTNRSLVFVFANIAGLLAVLVFSDRYVVTYYDHLIVRFALYTTFALWMASAGMSFAIFFARKGAFLLALILLAGGLFGLTVPLRMDTQQTIAALTTGPSRAQGPVQAMNSARTRSEAIHTITINDIAYRVQPQWYQVLQHGDMVTFVHDPAKRFAFPHNAVSFTDTGRNLLFGLVPLWLSTGIVVWGGIKHWLSFWW